MQKLGVFKIMEDERLELCGFFSNKEDAIAYLEHVKNEITFKYSLAGEYVCIPLLYFKLDRD
jgi:hypothetical protein